MASVKEEQRREANAVPVYSGRLTCRSCTYDFPRAAPRAANPTWRPGVSDAEHSAWDLERLAAAQERGDF